MFDNPLLNQETRDIYTHPYPEHTIITSMIIHTEQKDHYPENILGMDVTSDYDGNLSDEITISFLTGVGTFKELLFPYRENTMITLIVWYNGKKVVKLYKAVLLSNPDMSKVTKADYSNDFKNEYEGMEITYQLVNPVYTMMKHITLNDVIRNNNLETIMRHYLSREMEKITVGGRKIEPIIDLVKPHNDRIYENVIIDDRVRLLDLPLFLQTRYGVYNGGMGTYVHRIEKGDEWIDVISIFPNYNVNITPDDKMRMTLYISDMTVLADTNNKTVVKDGKELRVIGTSMNKRIDVGDASDFDFGVGFKSINSNQVLDRVYEKEGRKVYAAANKMIDSQKDSNSDHKLAQQTFNVNTDNLYAVRSMTIRNKSKHLTIQWNFSRPDYLIPAMGVDIVYVKDNKIKREKGILISHHTRYDNMYKNCTTLLNICINSIEENKY